jgi:hypothetical protein
MMSSLVMKKFEIKTANDPVTTALVVVRPTSSVPPRQLKPL